MAIVNVLIEPNQLSSDAIWMQWHKDLKSVLGKKTADSIFLQFWTKRGSADANTHALREYAAGQGFTIEGDAISSIVDSVYSIGDNIGDVLKLGKYVTYAVLIVIIGGMGLLIFNIAKQPLQAIKAAKS
jgi:hypothetical protein